MNNARFEVEADALRFLAVAGVGAMVAIAAALPFRSVPTLVATVPAVIVSFAVPALLGRTAGVPAAVASAFALAGWHLADEHGVLRTTADSRTFFFLLGLCLVVALASDRRHNKVRRVVHQTPSRGGT